MKMPVLFAGHGSPMNAIEKNRFSESWKNLGNYLRKPKVIIGISAHWYSDSFNISYLDKNLQIFDMYGFPEELYKVRYAPNGSLEYAEKINKLFDNKLIVDNTWGIDHGIWTVLVNMYPQANIPVVMMSVNVKSSPREQFEIGIKLKPMRDEGALILASGNIVHNLRILDWEKEDGYDWAYSFDNYIKQNILNKNYENIINYDKSLEYSKKVFATTEHFYPLLAALGSSDIDDSITVFNDSLVSGSISMTSYLFEYA